VLEKIESLKASGDKVRYCWWKLIHMISVQDSPYFNSDLAMRGNIYPSLSSVAVIVSSLLSLL
jgi:hypothetical protein